MTFTASLLVGISVVNIGFIKFKCFQAKLEKVTNKDIVCCIVSLIGIDNKGIKFFLAIWLAFSHGIYFILWLRC
jgi:hypothetical protein